MAKKIALAETPPLAPKKKRLASAQGSGRELWYRPTVTGWTPERVQRARDGADTGLMLELADLVETIHRDARVAGVLSTLTHGLMGLPIDFVGGDPDATEALEGTDEKPGEWWQMHNEAESAKLLRWGLMLGVGLAHRVELPRIIGRPHRYRIEAWSPRWLTYHHYGFMGANWTVLTTEGMHPVVPGDGEWILYQPYGARRPWTEGLWEQVAFPWLLKHFAMEDRANFSEVLGSPIFLGMTSHGATEKQRNRFLSQMRTLGKNGKMVMPQGWDMKLVEAASAGKSGDVFDQIIKDSNEEITIAIASQLVTTEGTAGFSQGNVQESIHQDRLRFAAESFSSCLRAQSLEPWAMMNYGSSAAAPWPQWETEKPEDVSEEADGLQKLGSAVTALDAALKVHGQQVNVKRLLEKFSIPTLAADPLAPPVPAPAAKAPGDTANG